MGRIAVFILALFVLTSFTGPGDPPEVGISFKSYWRSKSVAIAGYTKINARYEWVAGAFDSGLHVPQYNGVPSGLRSGVWTADGAVAVDTSNHRLYFYSGGSWRYSTSGTGGGTPTLQQVLTAGSTLTTNNTVDGGGNSLVISSASPYTSSVGSAYIDTAQAGVNVDFDGKSAVSEAFVLNGKVYANLTSSDTTIVSAGTTNIKIGTAGGIKITPLNYTLSTTGKKIMLRDTATGLVQNIDPALLGGSTAISSLTAATGTNTINNGSSLQTWQWNTLGSVGMKLESTSTAALFNLQNLAYFTLSGANATATQTTTTLKVENVHTGTSSTNVGLRASASGGTNNYAIIVPLNNGSVGIGTTTPSRLLHVSGKSLFEDSLRYSLGASNGYVLTSDANGNASWQTASVPATAISSLTAATGTNTIDNGAYKQEWQWNSLAGTNGFKLSSNSTAAVDGQRFAFISSTGANASSTVTTTALTVSNDHTGTSSTNVAGYFASNDGTNNYAIIVPGGGGSVGIGTSTPASILHTVGTVRHASLGTASGDTTTNKPVGINSSGDIIPMTYWPGGGGGGGVTTMGAIGSSPNANGATISGSTLNLEPASASFGGVVTTGTQTIAGNKTFTGVSVFGSPTVPVGNFQVGGTIWISGGAGSTYYAVHDGTNQAVLAPTFMTFTGLGSGSIGYASGVMNIQGNATYSTVVNDNSADVDFRLEGDGDANLIFADAGNDKVGIGTASPTTKLHVAGRFAATQGADVASAAGAITLGTDGNTFEITGTAAITLISNAGWVNGSEINLVFTSTATLTDGTANSGTDIGMELAGNANFTASADDILTLVLTEVGGTQRWREKSRSVN